MAPIGARDWGIGGEMRREKREKQGEDGRRMPRKEANGGVEGKEGLIHLFEA